MKTIASLEGVDIIQKNYQQVIIRGDGKEEFNQLINKEISMILPSKNLEVVTDTNSISNYDRTASAYMNLRIDALTQQFLISGSEKMRLNATGLGIGTTAPSVPLEIVGAISLMLSLFADIVITFAALTELSMPVLVVSCLRK